MPDDAGAGDDGDFPHALQGHDAPTQFFGQPFLVTGGGEAEHHLHADLALLCLDLLDTLGRQQIPLEPGVDIFADSRFHLCTGQVAH